MVSRGRAARAAKLATVPASGRADVDRLAGRHVVSPGHHHAVKGSPGLIHRAWRRPNDGSGSDVHALQPNMKSARTKLAILTTRDAGKSKQHSKRTVSTVPPYPFLGVANPRIWAKGSKK